MTMAAQFHSRHLYETIHLSINRYVELHCIPHISFAYLRQLIKQYYQYNSLSNDNIKDVVHDWITIHTTDEPRRVLLMRYGPIAHWDVSKVTNMQYFSTCFRKDPTSTSPCSTGI